LDKLKKLLNQRQIFEFNNYVKCFIKNYVIWQKFGIYAMG
jgi:hypothetical protein